MMKQSNTTKPRLLESENAELFAEKGCGNLLARQKLIEINMGAVISVAKSFKRSIKLPLEDLISIGTFGLIKAVDSYIPELGDFSDFLFPCIKQTFIKYIDASNMQKRKPKCESISLQDYFYPSDDSELTYEALIFDQVVFTEDEAMSSLVRAELEIAIDECLTVREAQILKFRFGFFNNDIFALQDIGDFFNLTRQRVSQLTKEALLKLSMSGRVERLKGIYTK